MLRTFSIEQLEYWAVETGFMKRKTKLKPEHFLLLCSCLGESIGKKSLVQLCAQLCATFDLKLTAEGLNQRFNPQAVKFLKKVFESLFSKQLAMPITEKIMLRYLGSTEHPIAKTLISYVRKGDAIILEIIPSYFSTWDDSKISQG